MLLTGTFITLNKKDSSMSQRFKVLLIGTNGQVGSELVSSLAKLAHTDVVLASRDKTPSSAIFLDLLQPTEMAEAVATVNPDLIINAAAYTAVDKAETERDMARIVNADAVQTLAVAAKKYNCGLVHFSTDYVFSGTGSAPFRENDPKAPMNYYGETKALGEKYLEDSGCRWVNFRTQWVYAPHGHNFVKTMLKLGRDRKELKIIDDQWGAPTSARVIAAGVTAFIERERKRQNDRSLFDGTTGHYHLACGGETTWFRFAEQIFANARKQGFPLQVETVVPIATEQYPTPAKRPKNSRLDTSKLTNFGISLPDWRDELEGQIPQIIKTLG